MQSKIDGNLWVKMSKAMKEVDSCQHLLQLSITSQLDLQKQIIECESRLSSCKDILVEKETIFSSLEHELLCLDGVVKSSKKCILLTLKQRQACEDEVVGYELTQIANEELKEIEYTHKTLLKYRQMWQGQINSHLEMVDKQKNLSKGVVARIFEIIGNTLQVV